MIRHTKQPNEVIFVGTQEIVTNNIKFSAYDGNIVINAFDSRGARVLVNLPAESVRHLRDFLNQTLQSNAVAPPEDGNFNQEEN